MYVDAGDGRLGHYLMFDGYWESWVALGVRSCLEPGMTAVDIGANHGYYSLLMANAVGATGRVIAIEPQRKLAGLLRRSVLANGLHDVIDVRHVAMSDRSGNATMVIPIDFSGNGSLRKDYAELELPVVREEVPCARLDDEMADRRVDFVKIDVEGAESEVFAGMQRVIQNNARLQIGMEIEAWQPGHLNLLADLQLMSFRPHIVNYSGDLHEVSYHYLRSRAFEPMVIFRRGF